MVKLVVPPEKPGTEKAVRVDMAGKAEAVVRGGEQRLGAGPPGLAGAEVVHQHLGEAREDGVAVGGGRQGRGRAGVAGVRRAAEGGALHVDGTMDVLFYVCLFRVRVGIVAAAVEHMGGPARRSPVPGSRHRGDRHQGLPAAALARAGRHRRQRHRGH